MTHPAKFTDAILERAVAILDARLGGPMQLGVEETAELVTVLDPMAGTGKGVDYLAARGYAARGIDLEPASAWGDEIASPLVEVGNALELELADDSVDVVFTSPTYGNRFADVDLRPSVAGTYAKGLGRRASSSSSCHMQWGPRYQAFHREAWAEAVRVLKPGGLFLLNISDHYRAKVPVGVAPWHLEVLVDLGLEWVGAEAVPTPRMTRGANPTRCEVEWLFLLKLVPAAADG